MLKNKRILLIISGGIAAYKSLELIRRLKEHGVEVAPILTRGGAEFVTPLSVASLAGHKVYQELFDLDEEAEMGHIELSRSADLIVVAPATAHLIAKMAQGFADDLASTTLLATDTAVLVAPAMNVRMWENPSTQRNVSVLEQDGVDFVGPNEGTMACGEFGPGRLAEPIEIIDAIARKLSENLSAPLAGKRVLVTAGPTHEPIDPVRYIANRSSGKQGFAIAREAAKLGAETILIAGPTALATPVGVRRIDVETAEEMLHQCQAAGSCDVAIFAAAVADWRVNSPAKQKFKKTKSAIPELSFVENPDILATISQNSKGRPKLVIGFAAETEHVDKNAEEKRIRKGCDWIIANDVSPETGIMGGDFNQIRLITQNGTEIWPKLSKKLVAKRLVERIITEFGDQADAAE